MHQLFMYLVASAVRNVYTAWTFKIFKSFIRDSLYNHASGEKKKNI